MTTPDDHAAANRIAQHFNGQVKPTDVAGAIPLDASLLASVVSDAIKARLARPIHATGVVTRTFDVWCQSLKGHEHEVVAAAHGALEARRREIAGFVRAMGLDPETDGTFGVDFDKVQMGSVPNQPGLPPGAAGSPVVVYTLAWTPHDLSPSEPAGPRLVRE